MTIFAGQWGPYPLTMTNAAGIPSFSVAYEVVLAGTMTPATIYTDRLKSNPTTAPHLVTDDKGFAKFFADPATAGYDIRSGGRLVVAGVTVDMDAAEEQASIPPGTFAKPATSDTLSARPAATVIGQRYKATDVNGGTLYESIDGSTWTQMAPGISEASAEATARAAADTTLTTNVATNTAAIATKAKSLAVLAPREVRSLSAVNAVMATPPTVGALANATAISGGVVVAAGPVIAVANAVPNESRFSYLAGNIAQHGTVNPDYNYMRAKYLTDPFLSPAAATGAVEFMFDGTTLEILFKGVTNTVWVAVDDEYVASTSITVPNDGATKYLPITFSTRAMRRIRVEFNALFIFGGVQVGPTDTVIAPPRPAKSPLVIVHGDSFSEGGSGGYSTRPWWRTMGNALRWRNVWSTSLGGTGWLATGSGGRPTLRGRLSTDVIPYSPDVLILAGGINDTASSESAITTEVGLALAQVASALPKCLVVVLSPFWHGGVEGMASVWPVQRGVKAAAAAAGVMYLDLLELPVIGTPAATTLNSAVAISATSCSTVGPISRNTFIRIDDERRQVTTCAGSGPYTVTVTSAFTTAHSSGAVVTEVGGPLWTGTGKVGATTGVGNSDLLVGSDGTHPTQAGSDAIGLLVAQMLAGALAA